MVICTMDVCVHLVPAGLTAALYTCLTGHALAAPKVCPAARLHMQPQVSELLPAVMSEEADPPVGSTWHTPAAHYYRQCGRSPDQCQGLDQLACSGRYPGATTAAGCSAETRCAGWISRQGPEAATSTIGRWGSPRTGIHDDPTSRRADGEHHLQVDTSHSTC